MLALATDDGPRLHWLPELYQNTNTKISMKFVIAAALMSLLAACGEGTPAVKGRWPTPVT